jgi:hypothetical protein
MVVVANRLLGSILSLAVATLFRIGCKEAKMRHFLSKSYKNGTQVARLGFSASVGTFEPSFGYEQGFLNLFLQESRALHRQFYATLKIILGK